MVCTMLAMANTDKTFTANLYMPIKGAKVSFEALSKEEDFVAFMHEYFPDASKHMQSSMLQTIRHGPRSRLVDIKCSPWHINNFCLVGDAAHAIFPFFGQGLNCGLEDCTVLMELHDQYQGDWKRISPIY